MKKFKTLIVTIILILISICVISCIFILKDNDKENDKAKIENVSTSLEIKEEDSSTTKILTTLNTSSKKSTKKSSTTKKSTKKKSTTNSITTEKSTSKKVSTTTKVVTSKPVTSQTTSNTTTTQTTTESCEKKFLFSWFRPDFESMSECEAMGEKYIDPYGYTCYYMQDNCGTEYYMLRLWLNDGDWIYYKDISLPE